MTAFICTFSSSSRNDLGFGSHVTTVAEGKRRAAQTVKSPTLAPTSTIDSGDVPSSSRSLYESSTIVS